MRAQARAEVGINGGGCGREAAAGAGRVVAGVGLAGVPSKCIMQESTRTPGENRLNVHHYPLSWRAGMSMPSFAGRRGNELCDMAGGVVGAWRS